ncbi:MAG: hypothetical protein AAGE98_20690 [Actinomycetota bacterium]
MADPQVIDSLHRARRWLLISFPVAWVALVFLWQMSLLTATGVALALWIPVGGLFFVAATNALEEETRSAEPSTFEPRARVGFTGRLAAFAVAALPGAGFVGPVLALPPAIAAFAMLAIAWVQPPDRMRLAVGFAGGFIPMILLVLGTSRHPFIASVMGAWLLMLIAGLWLIRSNAGGRLGPAEG